MYGTGVSDSTVNSTLPHWQLPLSFFLRFTVAFGMRPSLRRALGAVNS